MRSTALAVSTLVALAAVAASASAQDGPPRAHLEYDRGEEDACPDASAIESAVSARLGYVPFVDDAPLRIEVHVRRAGRTRRAVLRVTGADGSPRGERTVESSGSGCDELARALALAISVAIDPLSLTRSAPVEATELPEPVETVCPTCPEVAPAPVCPAPPEPTVAPAVAPERPEIGGFLGLGAHVAIEGAPDVTGGFVVEGGVELFERVAIAIEARVDVPVGRDATTGRGQVRAHFLGGSLVPCVQLLFVSVCGTLTLGAMRGEGSGVDLPRNDASFFATAGARVAVTASFVEALELRVFGEVDGTLTPTLLDLSDRTVWRAPDVSGTVGVRLIWSIR